MKILKSLIDPNSRLIIEDDEPAINQGQYSGQAPVAAARALSVEALPLPVPCMSEEKTTVVCESGSGVPRRQAEPATFPRYMPVEPQVLNVPAASGGLEPLPLPVMNFGPAPAKPATRKGAAGIEALPLPIINFEKIKAGSH
jgi:hypothetical protein